MLILSKSINEEDMPIISAFLYDILSVTRRLVFVDSFVYDLFRYFGIWCMCKGY